MWHLTHTSAAALAALAGISKLRQLVPIMLAGGEAAPMVALILFRISTSPGRLSLCAIVPQLLQATGQQHDTDTAALCMR